MEESFNLLEEPWIPVRLAGGKCMDVNLLKLFAMAGQIEGLAEPSPVNLVALYRILLAMVHRALTLKLGRWTDRDRARWFREGLPQAAIIEYLEHFRERFWLFHPQAPFMQVAALAHDELTQKAVKPWTQISLGSASGAAPTLFDHSVDDSPVPISPAEALLMLLGYLQFTPGGFVTKSLRDSDTAAPLANTAAIIPTGASLQQTLCLCLHKPGPPNDSASWEVSPPSIEQLMKAPTLASGTSDRYSRLSRAVLFLHDADGMLRWVHIAEGSRLKEDEKDPDTMTSYRPGPNGLVKLAFDEGRALWRDLSTLLPRLPGQLFVAS